MALTATFPSMAQLVRSLDAQGLSALMALIQQESTKRKTEIEDSYGNWFCSIVGVERIYSLAVVEAQELDLAKDGKYPEGVVKPSMMKELSAVRGIMGSNRPFIAIKIEILDPTTRKVEGVVVELIFKRYSLDREGKGSIFEHNYVTALSNATEDGTAFRSCLYNSGGMIDKQITAVRDLLEGKEIVALCGCPKYLIRMAK